MEPVLSLQGHVAESREASEEQQAISVFRNANNMTIGSLHITVEHAPSPPLVSEAVVEEASNRRAGLASETARPWSSGFSVAANMWEIVSSVFTWWNEDGDSDSSIAVVSALLSALRVN